MKPSISGVCKEECTPRTRIHQSRGHCSSSPVSSERPRRNENGGACYYFRYSGGGGLSKVQTLGLFIYDDDEFDVLGSNNVSDSLIFPIHSQYMTRGYRETFQYEFSRFLLCTHATHVRFDCGMLIMSSSKWAKYFVVAATGSGLNDVDLSPPFHGLVSEYILVHHEYASPVTEYFSTMARQFWGKGCHWGSRILPRVDFGLPRTHNTVRVGLGRGKGQGTHFFSPISCATRRTKLEMNLDLDSVLLPFTRTLCQSTHRHPTAAEGLVNVFFWVALIYRCTAFRAFGDGSRSFVQVTLGPRHHFEATSKLIIPPNFDSCTCTELASTLDV
ncbi:hypothetical protein DFS33DRAFT_1456909 [Desarmillaria ectypa]|nr:hypothetical protein DFS33DRAFT_1456909 [Desarmillaria ectypa]